MITVSTGVSRDLSIPPHRTNGVAGRPVVDPAGNGLTPPGRRPSRAPGLPATSRTGEGRGPAECAHPGPHSTRRSPRPAPAVARSPSRSRVHPGHRCAPIESNPTSTPRRARPAGRMMPRYHRLPAPTVGEVVHPLPPHRPPLGQGTHHGRIRDLVHWDRGPPARIRGRPPWRPGQSQSLGQCRQRLRGRRHTPSTWRVAPVGALAPAPRQGMTSQLTRAQGLGQPRQRDGIERASSDLPA